MALLVAAAILAGAVSGGTMFAQTRARTRIMAEAIADGRVDEGRGAIRRYGCGACHVIGGISEAVGTVGPGWTEWPCGPRSPGTSPNDPQHLIVWLRHPQAVAPGNGMPEQGVTERDARDMAAYLYTLKQ